MQDSFRQLEEDHRGHYAGCDSCDVSLLAFSARPLAVFHLNRECLRGVLALKEEL